MRAQKWLLEFASWRWAPTVALVGGTLLYIFVILLLVPDEIGLPGVDAKFTSRAALGTSGASSAYSFANRAGATPTATATATEGDVSPPPPPMPPPPQGNFGARGFSPPLPRAEVTATATPEPMQAMPPPTVQPTGTYIPPPIEPPPMQPPPVMTGDPTPPPDAPSQEPPAEQQPQ